MSPTIVTNPYVQQDDHCYHPREPTTKYAWRRDTIIVAAMEKFLYVRCLTTGRQLPKEGMYVGTHALLSDGLWHILGSAVIHILPLHAAALLYPVSWDRLGCDL